MDGRMAVWSGWDAEGGGEEGKRKRKGGGAGVGEAQNSSLGWDAATGQRSHRDIFLTAVSQHAEACSASHHRKRLGRSDGRASDPIDLPYR